MRTTGLRCSHSLGMLSFFPHPCPHSLPVTLLLILCHYSSETSFPIFQVRVNCALTCTPRRHGHLVILLEFIILLVSAYLPPHPCVRSFKDREPVQRWIQVLWSFETRDSWGQGEGTIFKETKVNYECKIRYRALEGDSAVSGCDAGAPLVLWCFLSCYGI